VGITANLAQIKPPNAIFPKMAAIPQLLSNPMSSFIRVLATREESPLMEKLGLTRTTFSRSWDQIMQVAMLEALQLPMQLREGTQCIRRTTKHKPPGSLKLTRESWSWNKNQTPNKVKRLSKVLHLSWRHLLTRMWTILITVTKWIWKVEKCRRILASIRVVIYPSREL